MEEIWKQINGYPEYKISNTGKVLGKEGKPLKALGGKVNMNSGGKTGCKSVAGLVYSHFIGSKVKSGQIYYRDGDRRNLSPDNLLSTGDRDRLVCEEYQTNKNIGLIADKFHLSVKTVKGILGYNKISFRKEQQFILPKFHHRGKMEYQNYSGENKIPFADNCTVRPKDYNHEAYLIRQFTYNY